MFAAATIYLHGRCTGNSYIRPSGVAEAYLRSGQTWPLDQRTWRRASRSL